MAKENDIEKIEISETKLEELRKEIRGGKLSSENAELLIKSLEWMKWVDGLLKLKNLSFKRLRRIIFGSKKTEKDSPKKDKAPKDKSKQKNEKDKTPAAKYVAVETQEFKHESLKAGDECPSCKKGNLYEYRPRVLMTFTGHTPLRAKKNICHGLRCATCGELFYPKVVTELQEKRYDASVPAVLALMRYNFGVPNDRLGKFQEMIGAPFPKATQWDLIEKLAAPLFPIYNELKKEAANGRLIYNDDTPVKVQEYFKEKRLRGYSTAIVSEGVRKISLFISGKKHAGKNMKALLKQRTEEALPLVMNDATANVNLKDVAEECLCLVHARRQFVDIEDQYKRETTFVIKLIGKIYHNDNCTSAMAPQDRLVYHQERSEKSLKRLQRWCYKMIANKKAEPNGPLGKAIKYLMRHWKKLTKFTTTAGAALDNNICERLVKTAIRHRKNSLFYKTENGALVGDIFMSVIQTCLNMKVDPFQYLIQIKKNSGLVFKSPEQWLPWNYSADAAHLIC